MGMNEKLKQRLSEIRRAAKGNGLLGNAREGYLLPGGFNYSLAVLDINVLLDRIDTLEAWIKSEAERSDSCTFALFGEVCEGCRCERLHSLHNEKSPDAGATE
jgi:hypothetical protein